MVHLQSQASMRGRELKRGDNPSEHTAVRLGSPSADVRGREKNKGENTVIICSRMLCIP